MLKVIEAARIRPMSWVKAGLYAIVIFLVYNSALVQLISHDWAIEDYSLFVPGPLHCPLPRMGKEKDSLRRFNRAILDRAASHLPWASSCSGSGNWAESSTRSTFHSGWWSWAFYGSIWAGRRSRPYGLPW